MDPLSATANCIAIVGIAYKSCQSLNELFHGLTEAPKEVCQSCAAVKSLAAILSHIISLHNEGREEQVFSLDFQNCLQTCASDVVLVEKRLMKMDASLRKGILHRSWTKLKWSSSADQWLGRFFDRVQTYNVVFSLELVALQMKSRMLGRDIDMSRNKSESSKTIHKDPVSHWRRRLRQKIFDAIEHAGHEPVHSRICDADEGSIASAQRGSTLSSDGNNQSRQDTRRLTQFLQSYAEPVAIRARTMQNCNVSQIFLSHWRGSLIEKRWSEEAKEIYGPSKERLSYGIGFSIRLRYVSRYAITLMIFLHGKLNRLQTMSMKWNLSLSSVVPTNAGIMDLAKQGDVENMRAMFEAGKAAHTDITPCGVGLLHVAARESKAKMVSFLLDCGADPNLADQDGETALHVAIARSKYYEVPRILIERGADMCNRDVSGKTPTHTLYCDNLRRIVACPAEPFEMTTQDDEGMTSLHYLAWSAQSTVASIEPLVEYDPSCLSTKDNQGRTFLFLAVERGNNAIVKFTLDQAVKPDLCATDHNGMSLLHYAVRNLRVQIIETLCKHGCDPEAIDNEGQSALHHATRRGNIEAVTTLLALTGSSAVFAKDRRGQTPLDLALHHGQMATAELFRSIDGRALGPASLCVKSLPISDNCGSWELFTENQPVPRYASQKLLRYSRISVELLVLMLLISGFDANRSLYLIRSVFLQKIYNSFQFFAEFGEEGLFGNH